jgi:hypothetical protein
MLESFLVLSDMFAVVDEKTQITDVFCGRHLLGFFRLAKVLWTEASQGKEKIICTNFCPIMNHELSATILKFPSRICEGYA